MLQMRARDGEDKRWFNPSRDLVYAWPKLVATGLKSFDDFAGVEGCSREELSNITGKLGVLHTKVMKFEIKHEEAVEQIAAIEKENPVAFSMIAKAVFRTGCNVYPVFCGQVKPKTPDDVPIPMKDVDKMVDDANIAAMESSLRWFLRYVFRSLMRKLRLRN